MHTHVNRPNITANAAKTRERVACQTMIFRIGLGPQRSIPGYDDGVEAAKAIVEFLSEDIPEPTIVATVGDHEVVFIWAFQQPVSPERIGWLATALEQARRTLGLRFATDTGEAVLSDHAGMSEMTEALLRRRLREASDDPLQPATHSQ